MDNGEEIQGLNEGWNFMGANASEWVAGIAMVMVVSEFFFGGKPATKMPLLIAIWVGTTISMATLRKKFPDETRGLRNYVMTSMGFEPPGMAAPSALKSSWSGAPVKELSEKCEFVTLGLAHVTIDEQDENSNNEDDLG